MGLTMGYRSTLMGLKSSQRLKRGNWFQEGAILADFLKQKNNFTFEYTNFCLKIDFGNTLMESGSSN